MPHIIVEYAKPLAEKLSITPLLEQVFIAAEHSELFMPQAIKVRAVAFEHYCAAENEQQFIHINCKILSGRTTEQKKHLSEMVIARVTEHLSSFSLNSLSITVEVSDLDKACYSKNVLD